MQLQHKMAANRAHQQQQQQQHRGPMNPYMYHNQIGPQHIRSMVSGPMQYQPSMAGISPTGYGSPMYGAPVSAPHMSPAPARICNTSKEIQIISSSTFSPANITLRKLPFFNFKHPVLKPIILNANSGLSLPSTVRSSATQEFTVSFVLTCDMASDLAMHRDLTKNEFVVQAQIRITAIDSNVTNNVTEYDDFLPLGLLIRVNNRQCNTLPPCSPSTRQGVESRRIPRPINVTQFMKLSPMNVNTVTINWAHEANKNFVVTLNIVEKLTSEFLLKKLKEKPPISIDVTKLTIRQQYKRVIDDDDDAATDDADDDDIATTIVRVSLQCPLAKFRMQYPAKGKNCGHLQCFDGSAYIYLNEKKPMWMCPVCSRPLYYDDLVLDQYFTDVLSSDQLSDDCQEVQLFVDGCWKSYDEENTSENADKSKTQSNSPGASPSLNTSVVSTADSSDDTIDRKDLTVAHSSNEVANTAADPVVDLTSEDEEVPECSTNNETAVSNSEERSDSNSSSSASAAATAPQSSDNEKAKESDSMDVPSEQCTEAETVGTVISSAVDEVLNLPIISLDSPSPPSFPASTTPVLAGLNLGKM